MGEPSKRVFKACDACKLRKVKCNGQERCQQCSHLGLKCIYSPPLTKRTQGKRGRIISEYKSKTFDNNIATPPILAADWSQRETCSSTEGSVLPEEQYGPLMQHSLHSSQYDREFFLTLVPGYMEHVYPVQPVITESEVRESIHSMGSDQEMRSFVYAFGACTLNLTRFGDSRTNSVQHDIEMLMNYSIENSKSIYASFRPTVIRAMESMFLHNCLMTLQASDAAFYYMRNAISIIQLLQVDNEEIMASIPSHERSRRQRLYWQAFIHERFLAILDYRQAILPPLDSLPKNDPTIPIAVHEGFNQIIKLFRLLDTEFLRNWLESGSTGNVTSAWVEAKSLELEGHDDGDFHELAILSTMQRADLAITKEWLRTLVWRLAMGQTLLTSRSSQSCFSLLFPVRLSQSLRQQVTTMSREDIEVHGSSIVQKLFDITDTIANVLIHVPATTLEETALRIDDFLFILDFVLLFPTLDSTRRGILLEKLERLQAMFPEVYSTTNSPHVPDLFDLHSPTSDPWYHIAHSKVGSNMNSSLPGHDVASGFQDANSSQSDDTASQKAAWNRISRRLSVATFAP